MRHQTPNDKLPEERFGLLEERKDIQGMAGSPYNKNLNGAMGAGLGAGAGPSGAGNVLMIQKVDYYEALKKGKSLRSEKEGSPKNKK
jgi:hypothetical protein